MEQAADTLLICAGFFGYAREIKRHLEMRGRSVALFEDRPVIGNLTKGVLRVAPSILRAKADAYFDSIIAQAQAWPIKDVLVIKGEALSQAAIRAMRKAFPSARFTLYFWDAYLNMPRDSRKKVALFDRVLTFDPRDAAQDRRMTYRPLFYVEDEARPVVAEQDIDLLFFGTMHGDRHAVLKRIERVLPKHLQFQKVLYLPASWLYPVRALRDPTLLWGSARDFIYAPKTKAEIAILTARSRIVVDIERPVQRGYTIRAIEVLRAGRKLITTNPEMANADFYNPANIAIVDRKAPKFSEEFLHMPYEPPPAEILQRYSLDSWLDEVMPQTR